MKNSSLLCLTLLLVTASPIAGVWSQVLCDSGGNYAANSTYEDNLRRLAAVLPAEVSASPDRYVDRSIGYWPNRLQAVSSCWGGDHCAACIADAFERVKIQCPFHKEADFYSDSCSLRLHEFSIFESDLFRGSRGLLVSGMIFQGIGLVCLFIMFLRAWYHDTKKETTAAWHREVAACDPYTRIGTCKDDAIWRPLPRWSLLRNKPRFPDSNKHIE